MTTRYHAPQFPRPPYNNGNTGNNGYARRYNYDHNEGRTTHFGRLDPYVFTDWSAEMDQYFDWYDMSDNRRVRFAKMKL